MRSPWGHHLLHTLLLLLATHRALAAYDGWHLSPTAGWSCDQVCSAAGLSCSEADNHAHNSDVSSSSGMQSIIGSFGKHCGSFNSGWGKNADVPNWRTTLGTCYVSDPSRTVAEFNCGQGTFDDSTTRPAAMLCYCSSVATNAQATCGDKDGDGTGTAAVSATECGTGYVYDSSKSAAACAASTCDASGADKATCCVAQVRGCKRGGR
jgi:hypothetical protein